MRLRTHHLILIIALTAVSVSSAAQTNAPAATPETVERLISTLHTIFDAEKTQDPAQIAPLYASLAIPDHAAWFTQTFGEQEGARLEAKYTATLDQSSLRLKQRVQSCLAQAKTTIGIHLYVTPADSSIPLTKAVLTAMIHSTRMYQASCSSSADDKSPFALGDFVYAQGGFRYLDEEVMRALSTAPPMRVRIAGAVQSTKLLKKVDPVYPHEAWIAGIQGIVKLHVVLETDGTVKDVDVISGHPLLVQPALDAVRDWRYKPTTLNGEPVEVDTVIEVDFSLTK